MNDLDTFSMWQRDKIIKCAHKPATFRLTNVCILTGAEDLKFDAPGQVTGIVTTAPLNEPEIGELS